MLLAVMLHYSKLPSSLSKGCERAGCAGPTRMSHSANIEARTELPSSQPRLLESLWTEMTIADYDDIAAALLPTVAMVINISPKQPSRHGLERHTPPCADCFGELRRSFWATV